MLAAHKCLAKAWQAQDPLAPGRRGRWGHWERRRDIQTRWEIQNASAAPAIKRVCLKRGNARLSFELHSRQTQSCFLDNRSLQTSAWDLNRSSGRSGQMFGKTLTATSSWSKRVWKSVIKRPICGNRFFLKKRATPLCTKYISTGLPLLSKLHLYDVKQGRERGLLLGHQCESGPAASETDGAGLCACELQTWPALQQLQHGFTPVTDFIANCGEPEYGEVVVIKRFNGMLGALDFDCFFFSLPPLSPL